MDDDSASHESPSSLDGSQREIVARLRDEKVAAVNTSSADFLKIRGVAMMRGLYGALTVV